MEGSGASFENLYNAIDQVAVVSKQGKDLLTDCLRSVELKKGDFVLRENGFCNAVYFVEKGYLRSFYLKEGKEINTGFYLEGSFVSNTKSLRDASPSTYSIVSAEDVQLWEFNKTGLLALYRKSKEIDSFGRKMLEILLISQEEQTNLLRIQTPTERYEYLTRVHPELLQRIPLFQLSSWLGVSRETISRIRKK